MATRKLFYEDCHTARFTAHVTSCAPAPGGWRVALDATAFYPEGGGQPWDLGTLGAAKVLEVREQDGEVFHLCDRPLAVGETVEGQIDWPRRFGFMQQHTGEHIVSGLIFAQYGFHNVGFHMGAEAITIDFDGILPPEALTALEAQANQMIWENRPVRCWTPEPEALAALSYRSKRALPWPVRIVEVPGCDRCACCGVHVAATGEIGLVKLLSCVRFRQGVRIEMVCGGQALSLLSRVYEQNRQVSQAFSAKMLETGAAARRMNEQLASEKYRAAGLEMRIFDGIAARYAGSGPVAHFEPELAPAALRELAERIARACGGPAAVYSGRDGEKYGFCLFDGGSDAAALGRAAADALNGRGGGRGECFQGTLSATRTQVEAYFRGLGWMLNL